MADVDVLAVDGGAELLLVSLLAVQAALHHLLLCPRVLCHPRLQPQPVTHTTLSPQRLDTTHRTLKANMLEFKQSLGVEGTIAEPDFRA